MTNVQSLVGAALTAQAMFVRFPATGHLTNVPGWCSTREKQLKEESEVRAMARGAGIRQRAPTSACPAFDAMTPAGVAPGSRMKLWL